MTVTAFDNSACRFFNRYLRPGYVIQQMIGLLDRRKPRIGIIGLYDQLIASPGSAKMSIRCGNSNRTANAVQLCNGFRTLKQNRRSVFQRIGYQRCPFALYRKNDWIILFDKYLLGNVFRIRFPVNIHNRHFRFLLVFHQPDTIQRPAAFFLIGNNRVLFSVRPLYQKHIPVPIVQFFGLFNRQRYQIVPAFRLYSCPFQFDQIGIVCSILHVDVITLIGSLGLIDFPIHQIETIGIGFSPPPPRECI